MSVIDVTKMWSRTGGNYTSDKWYGFANKIAITEGYQVLAEVNDHVGLIEAAAGLPDYNDQHPSGELAWVRAKKCTPLGPCFWMVLVEYEGEVTADAVEIEWADTSSTEPIDRDYNGRAIVTANFEQVEGLTVELADPVAVISREFLSVDPYALRLYRRSTNSDTFLGWPPGTARLVGYSAKTRSVSGGPLERWRVTARIQFREPLAGATAAQAWYVRWRHEGLYMRDTPGGIARRATDGLGQEVTKPILLKADGTPEPNPDNAVWIYTQVYGSLPYSGLGLL